MTDKKAPFGLDEWLEELSHMDAVTMGAVIRKLNMLTESEESSVQQLSQEILKDPSLTSKILKIANSVVYNPAKTPMATISRAIMHIGFTTIREICVSAIVIEALLRKHPRESLLKQLARSLHAAVQARNLCEKAKPELKEEVFVAALLLHLGELLIWSYPHPAVDKVYRLYRQGAGERDLEAVTGVTFNRLTLEIASEWSLGDTLAAALSDSKDMGKMSQAVLLGDEISVAMEKGWDSPEMAAVMKKVSVFANQPVAVMKKKLQESTAEAAQLSKLYGDPKLTSIIRETQLIVEESGEEVQLLQPNPQLQLETLQGIMQLMTGNFDTSQLFGLALKGLHEGVGLERVVLAIFNQNRTQIAAKYVIGQRTVNWKDRFRFEYERSPRNLFAAVMNDKQAVWVGNSQYEKLESLRTPAFNDIVGTGGFLLGPVTAQNRELGFLYSDLRVSGRPLTQAYFTGFKHFLQQVSLCLGILANKR